MFSTIKKYFFDRSVKNRLSYSAIVRNPSNFEQARTIGILVDATSEANRAAAVQYAEQLRKNGKQIDVRGFVNAPDPVENFPFKTWNSKSLAWSGQLSDEAAGQFWNTQYDILINLCTQPCAPLTAVSTLSRAHFRVAAFLEDTENAADLMIDLNGNTDIKYFIGQIDFYMKKINA
jgi:hypothetical protein